MRLVISFKFGISDTSDVYWALITIPEYMIVLSGFGTLNGVANSQYSALLAQGNFEELKKSFTNLFSLLFIVGLIVLFIIVLFNRNIVKMVLPGFPEAKYNIAITYSLIIFPVFFFRAFTSFFSTVLNTFNIFALPAFIQILLPILVIISAFIPYYKNDLTYNLSISNLIGNILTTLVLFIFLFKYIGKVKFTFFKIDTNTKTILKGCGVTFLLVVFQQLFTLSKTFFASFLEAGAISSLYYAGLVTGILTIIIFMSSFNLLLNHLSNSFIKEYRKETKSFFIKTILTMFSLLLPIVIVFIVLSDSVIRIIYLRGNFSSSDVLKTLLPFFWESLSLVNYLVYITFTTLFLAKKKYKQLTYIGVPVFASGILSNYIFSEIFGYYGIAISNFLISFLYAFLLVWYGRYLIGELKSFLIPLSKILLSGVIVAFTFIILKNMFGMYIILNSILISDILNTIIYTIIIFIFFNILTYLLKVNYLKEMKSLLRY